MHISQAAGPSFHTAPLPLFFARFQPRAADATPPYFAFPLACFCLSFVIFAYLFHAQLLRICRHAPSEPACDTRLTPLKHDAPCRAAPPDLSPRDNFLRVPLNALRAARPRAAVAATMRFDARHAMPKFRSAAVAPSREVEPAAALIPPACVSVKASAVCHVLTAALGAR